MKKEKKEKYLSESSAMALYASTQKKEIKEKHSLCQYFDVGAKYEGYWNFDNMALQLEKTLTRNKNYTLEK